MNIERARNHNAFTISCSGLYSFAKDDGSYTVCVYCVSDTLKRCRHTSAGALHVLQLIWKLQDDFVILFTLFSQEMKKRCVLADGFGVTELKRENQETYNEVFNKKKKIMYQSRVFINHSLFKCTTQPSWPRCICQGMSQHSVTPCFLSISTLPVKIKF